MSDKAIVLYDSDCAFCTKGIGFVRALDWLGRLTFQSCRDVSNYPQTPPHITLNYDDMIGEMHMLSADRQRVYVGFTAFRRMSWMLPALIPIAPFLYLPGVLPLGNIAYRWVARNRFKLLPCHNGACTVPRKPSLISELPSKSD